MAIVDRPRGLRFRRTLRGQVDCNQVIYETGGVNHRSIMAGDVVNLDTNGHVQIYSPSAAASRPLGVAVNLLNKNGRPFTHSQPNSGPLIAVSASGAVGVSVDPDAIYTVQWDTSLGQSDRMKFVAVTAGSGVTALGQSGIEAAGAVSASASLTHFLQVIGLADEIDPAADNNDIEVMFAMTAFGRKVGA